MQTPPPGEPTQPHGAPPPPPPSAPPPPGYGQPAYGSPQTYPAAQYANQAGFAPQAGPAPGLLYAGFWMRFLALFIDGILIAIISFILGRLFLKGHNDSSGNLVITEGQGILPVIYAINILYFPVTWAWLGETIGHRVLGMEIRRVEDGQRPGVGQVIVRFLGYIVCYITLTIGFIIAGFDARKQGLHDKIAGTVVVRKAM